MHPTSPHRRRWPDRAAIALIACLSVLVPSAAQVTGDFDGDGSVAFSDFLLFAAGFGGSDPALDLDGDGSVAFPDFLLFVDAFRTHNAPTPAPPPDPVSRVDGPVSITSASDLDAFLATVTESFAIDGALEVSGTELADLSRLSGLHTLGGDLTVEENPLLVSLTGLEGLSAVGDDLRILRNPSLTSLDGLEGLESVSGDLVLSGNPTLLSLTSLDGLTRVDGLMSIRDNTTLESLVGLGALVTIPGSLLIENNASLTSLSGLDNLESVGQIVSIRSNESLETLEGVGRLGAAQGLVITNNASLLPSEADFLRDQLASRGFSGLTTIEGNNVSADLTIVTGNFLVTTPEELEELRSLGGDRFMVDGSLIIHSPTIVNMEPLLTLVEVTGSLEIDRNPQLVNLDGLFSLRTVGKSLEVKGNGNLRSLVGLNRVRTVRENLIIFRNQQLETLNALRRLRVVGESIEVRLNGQLPDSAITAFRDTMRARGFEGNFVNAENGR